MTAVGDDVAGIARALTDCDELAFGNMHSEWARLSVAKDILASPALRDLLADAEQRGREATLAAVRRRADEGIEFGPGNFLLLVRILRDVERADRETPDVAQGPPVTIEAARAEFEDCRRCGGRNVCWFAPSPLWNYVMRGNDIDGPALFHDLVCIPCFIELAERAGVRYGGWCVTTTHEPEGLILVTPTGRVWNPERNLWDDPDVAQGHAAEEGT